MSASWEALERAAKQRGGRGRRALIPIIGSGFNAQASGGKARGWAELLREMATVAPSTRLRGALITTDKPISMTLLWETMITEIAYRERRSAGAVEKSLQRRVSALLRDAYPPGGLTREFVDRFLSLGFEDVLSFNFDAALDTERSTLLPPRSSNPLELRIERSDGTRIWYPHGHIDRPASILLGMRLFGTYIESLRSAFSSFKAATRGPRGGAPGSAPAARKAALVRRKNASTWLDAAIEAPLLFIGLSMGRDEWPLWWFLNQRARNFARRRGKHAPTFVFVSEESGAALEPSARLVGAELVTMPSARRQEGWNLLFDILRAR
jgi:hypothetical protein